MKHIKIEQTNIAETVTSQLINKLYKYCTNDELDNTSNIKGNLYSLHAYEDEVNYLTDKFKDLIINISGEYYVKFVDDVFANLVINEYGDGAGVFKAQLNSVTNFGDLFSHNTSITNLDLRYFTGIGNQLNSYHSGFQEMTNLTEVTLPPQITTFVSYDFQDCTNLLKINGLENITIFGQNSLLGCSKLIFELDFQKIDIQGRDGRYGDSTFKRSGLSGLVDIPEGKTIIGGICEETLINKIIFPSTTTSISWSICMNCKNLTVVICKALVPPTGAHALSFANTNSNLKIYVPDASVDAYKSANGWNNYANIINPLSEYTE